MFSFLLYVLLAPAISSAATVYDNNIPCPLLGPDVPAPRHPSQSNTLKKAIDSLQAQIKSAFNTTTAYGSIDGYNNSFSVDVFSVHEDNAIFTYHHTGDETTLASNGTKKVDSDTIYRIGSVSKMFTMYTYLVAHGYTGWLDPVTKYIPELSGYTASSDDINQVKWDEITVESLAGHLSGLPRDVPGPDSNSQALANATKAPLGHVPLNVSFCGSQAWSLPCKRADFFASILSVAPAAPPFSTPIYSNVGYIILSYVLESISGQAYPDLLASQVLQPLNMMDTYYTLPPNNMTSRAILPTVGIPWYNIDIASYGPVGSLYSTVNDLRKASKSMLNATLLAPAVQRRWLKPLSYTSDVNVSIGAVWEIALSPAKRTSFLYAKNGNINAYTCEYILAPDFDVGINIVTAGSRSGAVAAVLSSMTAAVIIPALEQAAKEEALGLYAGNYTSPQLNSTIQLVVDEGADYPGLKVSSWSESGTDLLPTVQSLTWAVLPGEKYSLRLYPTGLIKNSAGGKSYDKWRLIWQALPVPSPPGAFSQSCATWAYSYDNIIGNAGLEDVVFTLDSDGRAVGLEARGLDGASGKIIFNRDE